MRRTLATIGSEAKYVVTASGSASAAGATGDGLQYPGRRVGQAFGAAGTGVGEGLLAGGERLVDLVALVRELAEEVVELREPGLQVLQLEQQAGELLVAGLGGVRGGERAGDRLPEQRELGGELGAPLAVEAAPGGGRRGVARARLTPPRTSAIRSRMDVRTVASPMSSPATTSVTVRSPSVSSSSRSATGAASATVAIASASATSCSTSARWSVKASSRAR